MRTVRRVLVNMTVDEAILALLFLAAIIAVLALATTFAWLLWMLP